MQGPEAEPPPTFLAMLLAIFESGLKSPLCVMLPSRGDVARIAAVFHGLEIFRKTYEDRIRRFDGSKLTVGGNVCVRPQGDVFQYMGPWGIDLPEHLRLRTLPGEKRKQPQVDRSFPRAQVLRLEPTTRSSPKGGKASLEALEPVPIDELLGITTFGNRGIFSNEVVLVDGKDSFAQFCKSTYLCRDPGRTPYSVAASVPLGEIFAGDDDVELRRFGEGAGSGDPLIAVAHASEAAAKHCLTVPSNSTLVVFNGASRASNLQDFDDICQVQRVVVVAERHERDAVETLLNRGCKLWQFAPWDLYDPETRPLHRGVFADIARRAANATALEFRTLLCSSHALAEAVQTLTAVSHKATDDPQSSTSRVAKALWGVLNHLAGVVGAPDAASARQLTERIEQIARSLQSNLIWMPADVAKGMVECLEWARMAISADAKLGVSKQEALVKALADAQTYQRRVLLVARPGLIDELSERVDLTAQEISLASSQSIPAGDTFDEIICTSWPGGAVATNLASSFAAPMFTLLAYPFEAEWFKHFQKRQRRMGLPNVLSAAEKSGLLSQLAGLEVNLRPDPKVTSDTDASPEPPIEITSIETRLTAVRKGSSPPAASTDLVPARYVSFAGTRYSYLTPNHRVAVATEIIQAGPSANGQISERVVADINVGDFVVFPDSGDTELLHVLADKMLGKKANPLRTLAAGWKTALRTSGLTPQLFLRHAAELGEKRHILTIRHWFTNESQIGPRTRDDLALIALATNNKDLDRDAERVWAAISELRGAHLSAGMRLREVLMNKLPSVLLNIEQNGSRVGLEDLGSAWVVQIDAIAARDESRARNEVNRLLIDATTLLEGLNGSNDSASR